MLGPSSLHNVGQQAEILHVGLCSQVITLHVHVLLASWDPVN